MTPPDRPPALWLVSDIASAFGLLTRLPWPQTAHHRPHAAWAWPLVGAVVGALVAGSGWLAGMLGLSPALAAALALIVGVFATGALHEDGLADCADGFFGGWTPQRRLEIMKDSHIGSYGTLALLLTGLARWSALAALFEAGAFGAVVVAAMLSRAPMAAIIATLPNARKSGLSQSVGRPPRGAALMAVAFALTGAALLGPPGAGMALAAATGALSVAALARARIGGQTGDVLGASQQIAELCALCAAVALVPK